VVWVHCRGISTGGLNAVKRAGCCRGIWYVKDILRYGAMIFIGGAPTISEHVIGKTVREQHALVTGFHPVQAYLIE